MAYMRGTYYVYHNINGGVDIHVGGVIRPGDFPEGRVNPTPQAYIDEYDRESSKAGSHVRLPFRVMQDLAARFWLEMPEEKKQEYMNDPYYEPYRLRSRKSN